MDLDPDERVLAEGLGDMHIDSQSCPPPCGCVLALCAQTGTLGVNVATSDGSTQFPHQQAQAPAVSELWLDHEFVYNDALACNQQFQRALGAFQRFASLLIDLNL